MLSLDKFNELIEEFIVLHIVGNHKYDYARFASGIKEFEIVNAGDSRHLALSNMFCQGVDLDICRQLADHTDLTTTAGYCTNILNTLESSSIMKIQRELYNKELILHSYEYRYPLTNQNHISCCSSPEQPHKTGNVLPCIKENHLETCIGCQYYTPSASELTKELETRRKKLLSASKTVVKCLIHKRDLKIDDMDKLFLDAHAAVTRYQIACNEKTKEVKEKWLAQQNIQKMTS